MIEYYERLDGEYARLYRAQDGRPVEYWSNARDEWVQSVDVNEGRAILNNRRRFIPLTVAQARKLEPRAKL